MFAELVLAKVGYKSNPGSDVEKVFYFFFKLKAVLDSDFLSFYPVFFFCSRNPVQYVTLHLVFLSP